MRKTEIQMAIPQPSPAQFAQIQKNNTHNTVISNTGDNVEHTPQTTGSSTNNSTNTANSTDNAITPVEERFPQLTKIDSMDYTQRIEIFQHVLDSLQSELDENRE